MRGCMCVLRLPARTRVKYVRSCVRPSPGAHRAWFTPLYLSRMGARRTRFTPLYPSPMGVHKKSHAATSPVVHRPAGCSLARLKKHRCGRP
eukprot:6936297-Lingulodinium_polyedra.AAC.1